MKKLLALLMALVMVFALAACGSSTTTTDTEEPAAEDENPALEAGDGNEGVVEEIDPLTITFNCSNNEEEAAGQYASYFRDYINEATGGAITVNISFGGTLFASTDELDACGDGAIDMMIFGHSSHATELPVLCAIPDFAPESVQNAHDYFDYVFADADAGAAITKEAESYGVKYLSCNGGGANVFLATMPFDSLKDLTEKCSAFGNMSPAKFQAIGFTNIVDVFPWDYYTAFDTGLMDASQMDAAALYSMSVQEVAPYWMYDDTYAAGNFMTVCLDWWNNLSAAQQNAIQEACDATAQYSIDYQNSANETLQSDLEAAGTTFVNLAEGEAEEWWNAIFNATADTAMTLAEDTGNVEDVVAVLAAAAAYTNFDFDPANY